MSRIRSLRSYRHLNIDTKLTQVSTNSPFCVRARLKRTDTLLGIRLTATSIEGRTYITRESPTSGRSRMQTTYYKQWHSLRLGAANDHLLMDITGIRPRCLFFIMSPADNRRFSSRSGQRHPPHRTPHKLSRWISVVLLFLILHLFERRHGPRSTRPSLCTFPCTSLRLRSSPALFIPSSLLIRKSKSPQIQSNYPPYISSCSEK